MALQESARLTFCSLGSARESTCAYAGNEESANGSATKDQIRFDPIGPRIRPFDGSRAAALKRWLGLPTGSRRMKTTKKTQAMANNIQRRHELEGDGLVLDFRNLTAENQELLIDNVLDHFSPDERARIFILRSES
ncbi:hypothetical protein H6CHR_02615 [Variovorax sp. PBL-H6]|uniref:hypothetical protein n=1 Tax=Variovorax sp. PBL-H6 TaxID=434009 RepID=UPI0013173689|nr:hypothetical protein [Variovorax sp. PBL-H6]VTU26536.1 hypothetical protein H6CHR_02615 [Variovorax sp. PBL-H6]